MKDVYSRHYLAKLADAMQKAHPAFDAEGFQCAVLDEDWSARELKARMHHITHCLHRYLGLPYRSALLVLREACPPFGGYHGMFFPDYVQQYGLGNWRDSLSALVYFTQYSSSEFAVRPFIEREPERMMAQMLRWSGHANAHVRRLASEGCRPRLPWAPQLPGLIEDPSPILPILERLRTDDSLYVRKSVANNLNDIAKDHPETVLALVRQWRGTHPHTDWILKRGCRTLLKQGEPGALAAFDLPSPDHVRVVTFSCSPHVVFGEHLRIALHLQTSQACLGLLRIEYAIEFVRSGSKRGLKVFQWSEKHHPVCDLTLEKCQLLTPLSTRRLYPGEHILHLKVNGEVLATAVFQLSAA